MPMPREGVDYSFSKPTPAQLKAAGKTFACRYIGTPASGKNLTRLEADALRNAGIDVVANYEAGNAGWMQGGYTVGVNAARAAHQNAVACGMPPDCPIYFSCDFNATYDQYKNGVKPCLQGCASVIGKARVGIYGGLEQVDWAWGDGVASWVWQTYAWSFGQWSTHGHIQQYRNGVPLGSGTVDLDRAVQADFGQWDAQGQEDLSIVDDATKQYLDGRFGALTNEVVLMFRRLEHGTDDKELGPPFTGHDQIVAKLTELKELLSAGVAVTLTDAQLETLKQAVRALEGTAMVQLAVSPVP